MKAFIWRESVYKTGKCPECGAELLDGKNNEPSDNVLVDTANWRMYCGVCGLYVCRVTDYDGDGKGGVRMGRWDGGTE